MDTENSSMDVVVLGKSIGTASGWDQPDTFSIQFLDFTPNDTGVKFLGDIDISQYDYIMINFDTGDVQVNNEDITVDWSVFNKPEGDCPRVGNPPTE